MAIHKHEGEYLISSHRCWMPGCYATERAARLAFRLRDAVLQRLQDEANEAAGGTGGVIQEEAVRAALKLRPLDDVLFGLARIFSLVRCWQDGKVWKDGRGWVLEETRS